MDKHKEFAAYIRALDWAEHPVAVHTHANKPTEMYDPLLGDVTFDMTSIQIGIENADQFVEDWRRNSVAELLLVTVTTGCSGLIRVRADFQVKHGR